MTMQVHHPDATSVAVTISSSTSGDLSFTPMTLAWRDVWYAVVNPRTKAKLTLLRGITGIAHPGKMTILMGASGAGKVRIC